MDVLNDDCLLLIFKQLDLNERTKLRVVCKLFRDLVDSIKIHELAIYENQLPLVGRWSSTGKSYGLLQTVCVFDLNRFFNSPILLNQMRPLTSLVVYGERDTVVTFQSAAFDHLTHLELYKFRFADLTILRSPRLKYLVLVDLAYKDAEMHLTAERINRLFGSNREKMSRSLFLNGFDHVTSQQIRHLSIDDELDAGFLSYCTENGLFRALERLTAILPDLNSLTFLSDNCPTLKRLDLVNNPGDLILLLDGLDNPLELARSLRTNLVVHLFGVPFNRKTASSTAELLINLGSMLQRIGSQLLIYLDPIRFDWLQVLHREINLSEFFKLVNNVSGNWQTIRTAEFYKRFAHCEVIAFGLDKNFDADYFERFLNTFPNLNTISLASSFDFEFGRTITDILVRHNQIAVLDLEIWNDLKCFDFLFKFPRLKRLQLRLAHPIGHQMIIRLFEKLRHLCSLDVAFAIAADDQQDSIKRQVIDRLAERFNARRLVFDLAIFQNTTSKFVRYTFVREGDDNAMTQESKDRMYKMIEHKRGVGQPV